MSRCPYCNHPLSMHDLKQIFGDLVDNRKMREIYEEYFGKVPMRTVPDYRRIEEKLIAERINIPRIRDAKFVLKKVEK